MTAPETTERVGVVLMKALTRVWSRICFFHIDVPEVLILAVPAAHGSPNSLGHFAPARWRGKRPGDLVHEVVVVAEYLDRPASEIVETLIHEAAHAANYEKGIHDCSPNQYHNRNFKKRAEAMGLRVKQVQHYGFALTSLAEGTQDRYKEEIQYLQDVIIHRRRLILPPGRDSSDEEKADDDQNNNGVSSSRSRKAVCRCPFIIRVSKSVIDSTVIRCESCGQPFQLA